MTSDISITGIEFHLPEGVLDNERLAQEYRDWTADKILSKTGIRERHITAPEEFASDLAVAAAQKLMRAQQCAPETIDYLIYCTQSPDYILPTSACIIQERLGLPTTCGCLDINLGCSGYIYGLGLAKALVESGQAQCVLFLTADTYSKFIHPQDKSVRTLFGDAATATLVRRGPGLGQIVGPFIYGSDGKGKDNLIVPTRGLRKCFDSDAALTTDSSGNSRTINDLYMNGAEIFTFTLKVVPDIASRLLQAAKLSMNDVDLFVFHQANLFMLRHLQKKLSIPDERFLIAFEDVGNTVSSTIPIALKKAIDGNKIKPGALLMLVGFGVGYSWGGTLVRWRE